jgi:Zn-dependent peptidase ImmA (M78 family)
MIGEVLEILRRAQGLTQEELCGRTGLTQAALSRYENDQRMPDEATLTGLARELGVSQRFLLRDHVVRGALAVDVHMRRQKTTKASAWRRLEARLNKHRLHACLLFEDVSLRAEQSVPTFDPVDTPPSEAALMVRAQWRMPSGPVRNLTRWLESAGCLVFEEDFGTPRVDGLSQWVGDHPVLLINGAIPTDRKRLTLAHELGHLVLHNGLAVEDPEREANEFAAQFLMPEHVIRPELRGVSLGKLHDLKQVWGTSMQSLFERAFMLGVVTKDERTKFYQAMNARGWKVNEPGSDRLAAERPAMVTAIAEALREKGLAPEDIAEATGFDVAARDNPFLLPDRHLKVV